MPAENPEVVAPVVSSDEPNMAHDMEAFFGESEGAEVPPPQDSAPAVQPPPPTPEKHKHARWIERAAIEQGMSDEEIESTPTDALQQKVYASQQAAIKEAKRSAETRASLPERGQPKVEVPVVPSVEEESLELDEADWDPAFVKKWNKLVGDVKAKDKEIAELKQLGGQVRQQQAQTFQQKMSSLFSTMPHVFGSGPVEPDSAEEARQEAVLAKLNSLVAQGKHTTLDADFARVAKSMFGSIPAPEAAKPKVDDTRQAVADAYKNGGLARPTSRNAAPLPKGRQAAIADVTKLMQQRSTNGTGVDYEDEDVRDGLPD